MAGAEQTERSKVPNRTRIGGYEILAKLGQGGMGVVFKATQLSVGRTVALKVLPPRLARNADFVARFFREARSAARLSHPNIVQAIDAGEADGYYFFAMEFVDGQTVADLLKKEGPLPERRALEIVRDMASALAYAHNANIIHRDIKPGNILLASDGTPKLVDLGLAREASSGATDLTQAGFALGTPDYIAPEQVRGETNLDGRVDIYALGATLYHMLIGQPPYRGGTGNEVMAKHLSEPVPDPRSLNPAISRPANSVVRKAMAKEKERRYGSAAEMRRDVEAAIRGGRITQAMPRVEPKAAAPPVVRPKRQSLIRTRKARSPAGRGLAASAHGSPIARIRRYLTDTRGHLVVAWLFVLAAAVLFAYRMFTAFATEPPPPRKGSGEIRIERPDGSVIRLVPKTIPKNP